MNLYTLNEFENIGWKLNDYKISDESIELIKHLSNQVCDPNYVKTPIFKKNNNTNVNFNKKKKKQDYEISEEDWNLIRNFKKTEVEKKDLSPEEKILNETRLLLNKISNKNYLEISEKIIEKIDSLKDEESYIKISEMIFDYASLNKILCLVYATLLKTLIDKYETMKNIFHLNFKIFIKQFDNIEYVDANVDYDKFCDLNLVNEKRRSTSLFLTNLLKNEILKPDDIIHIIFQLQNLLFSNIEKQDFVEQNSEISENIFILITNSNSVLKKHLEWNSIIDNVDLIKKMKAKEKPSLSNKIIFKHMDIIDFVKKN